MESSIALERADPNVLVIVMEGEHDIYKAPALREKIDGAIEARNPVVIDLTPATFVDSSILGVLLQGRRRAHDSGLGFAVMLDRTGDSPVRHILDVTGLIPVFPVVFTRAEAVSQAVAVGGHRAEVDGEPTPVASANGPAPLATTDGSHQ